MSIFSADTSEPTVPTVPTWTGPTVSATSVFENGDTCDKKWFQQRQFVGDVYSKFVFNDPNYNHLYRVDSENKIDASFVLQNANSVGKGGFGTVFKYTLAQNFNQNRVAPPAVAVKKYQKNDIRGALFEIRLSEEIHDTLKCSANVEFLQPIHIRYDYGNSYTETKSEEFSVMEMFEGNALTWCRNELVQRLVGNFEYIIKNHARRCCSVVQQILPALKCLADKNYFYLDFKFANVCYVCKDDPKFFLIDLGSVARNIENENEKMLPSATYSPMTHMCPWAWETAYAGLDEEEQKKFIAQARAGFFWLEGEKASVFGLHAMAWAVLAAYASVILDAMIRLRKISEFMTIGGKFVRRQECFEYSGVFFFLKARSDFTVNSNLTKNFICSYLGEHGARLKRALEFFSLPNPFEKQYSKRCRTFLTHVLSIRFFQCTTLFDRRFRSNRNFHTGEVPEGPNIGRSTTRVEFRFRFRE